VPVVKQLERAACVEPPARAGVEGMMRSPLLSTALLSVLLAACGGGGGSGTTIGGSPPPASTPARGTLLESPPSLLSTLKASDLLTELSLASNAQILALAGGPICDILMYDIEYETVGGAGEPTTASAALLVPTGLGSACTGRRPMLLYAHGTTTDSAFTMASFSNTETMTLAALFATKGYIVVAPNYAGYDSSTLPYHPYLVADQQSKDMIDALTAARTALPVASATLASDSGQLYITGYSQGGFVAMATHRAMQQAGMPVTAAAPMSGPYALAAFVDAIFYGRVNGDATISSALLFPAYQKSYGNVYSSPSVVFASPYAATIEDLLPTSTPRSQLYSENELPEYALFSPTPPSPAFAADTPPTAPAGLAAVFALGFGSGNLINNSYRLAYLQDAVANPDGGFPSLTTGVTAASPGLAMRQALKNNDLRDWVPTAPTLLCGGDQDPLVFWMNTSLMQSYWAVNAPAAAAIGVLDLEAAPASGDPYATLKTDFAVAKAAVAASAVAQGATDGGALAVDEAYHAELVAPFCFAAVKEFFGNNP
jgi:hypothetical protein